MKKLIKFALVFVLLAAARLASAQTVGTLPVNYCNQGGKQANTNGLLSSNYMQGIIPSCRVAVYLTGSTTLATIYSDANMTPLSNPFTANSDGQFTVFASISQAYDVVGSGGNGNPNCTTGPTCYPSPTTLAIYVYPSGNFSPIAGVISISGDGALISNMGSTGNVALTLTNASGYKVWGNCSSGSGAPSYCSFVDAMLPSQSITPGSYTNVNLTVDQQGVITAVSNGSAGSAFYQTVQANSSSKPQEAKLNLISGSNVTVSCADNPGATSTDCTVSSSAGSAFYQTVQANGSSQTQQPKLNLISGTNATVSCANNSGASSTDCTVSATGGGGGNIPSNAIFAFVPTSASDDDTHVLSPAVALTSWSTTGSTTTVINTGTNGFSANQWVSMRFATSFPASPHGFTWYKVLSAGLSSTQFELDTTGVSPGTCSSTCGSAYNAMPYLPFATTGSPGMPTAAINNTYGSCGGTDPSSNACTLYGMETNYSTILHPISPAVTGVPSYLIVVGPNNDIGLNYTLANIKTYYQTLFSEAHTDGWVIAVLSPTGANFNQNGAPNAFANQVAIDTWLRGQGKTTVQATTPGSSQYWDIWSDVGSVDWDGGDTSIIATNTGYGPTGAKSAAVTLSSDIQTANGTVKPRRQLWWAGPVSGGSTGNNGYVFIPGTEPVATWRWMSADLTTTYAQLNHNTFSALEVFAGSINAGGCPGGRPLCTSGGFNIDGSNNLWAVNGILAGSGGSNLVCWNTNGGTTACGSSGLSGMTTGQVGVAGSSSTITGSKPIAGTGAGLASGPTSATVAGDVVTYADTAGTQQDSSTLLSSLAPKASPTFTGTPAAPTATGGTNTTQLATTAFVQAAIAAAGTGAGIVTYSGPALTFTGTLYFPIGGGGLSSATETNVDIDSPAAVTIQNMTVQLSTAPGIGNSIAFTWRKNASSQTLTCTISGASATSCSDTTHNFTTASLDLLDIQVVTTGSVVGTPTAVMAAQVGVAAPATGVTSVFGQTGAVPNLSGDVTTAGSSVATVKGINGVPLCTGFTPTTGQNLQYTTASSPNPCYTAASGGGTTVTAAPPYVEIGSTFYDHDFYAVTKPPVCASTTWLNSVTPSSCTNGTNGDVVIKTSSANQYWATQTATSSVEGVFSISSNTTNTSNVSTGGIWIYDSTNSKVYLLQAVGTGTAEYVLSLNSYNCTSPCSSTSPSGASNLFSWVGSGAYGVGGHAHLKLSVSGSTLTLSISLNGGVTFMTLATESVGTITKGGYAVNVSSTDTTMMDVQSILAQ